MEGKYGRLYPERAVVKARAALARLAPQSAKCQEALESLDRDGFPVDEPLFLLRGQDELAPDTVRDYIRLVGSEEGAFRGHRTATLNHLYGVIARMERWRPRKLPD